MYFLEPRSRWSPGLHTYIRGSESSDPECSFSDSAQSSESDSADIMDDMDLDVPMHLESPEFVQDILCNKFTVNEFENVLENYGLNVHLRSIMSNNNTNTNNFMYNMVPPNDIFNIKVEPKDAPMDVLEDTNPVTPNSEQRVPVSSGFSFSEHENDVKPVPEELFEGFLPHEDNNGLLLNISELPTNDLNSFDMTDIELNEEELFSCIERDIPMNFFPALGLSEMPQPIHNTYMSEDGDCFLGNDPFIGLCNSPKKQSWLGVFVTSDSTKEQMSVIRELENEVDILKYTHNYCKYIKQEPVSSRPASPMLELECHTSEPEHPVSVNTAPVVEKTIPVKRRPGRPRKNPLPTDPREKISVPKVRKPKRTAPPPAKKAKLTLKSSACNEKRLQHNELERNRRDAMRQSMEGVEHTIPDRILQLTQVALCHERNEKSEEVENDFTVEVFRHVEDLIRNKDKELRNVKCRKVNTKKGTKFPKMVVLLSAAFYVSYLERDCKSKEHKIKKNDQLIRHLTRTPKKYRKYCH